MRPTRIGSLIGIALLAACATVRVPLCPAIAEKSYPDIRLGEPVNRYLALNALDRNVRITVLAPVAAELSGGVSDIRWITRNYPWMLCAFDSNHVTDDQATFGSCMSHASRWMEIVNGQSTWAVLMVGQTLYAENCMK